MNEYDNETWDELTAQGESLLPLLYAQDGFSGTPIAQNIVVPMRSGSRHFYDTPSAEPTAMLFSESSRSYPADGFFDEVHLAARLISPEHSFVVVTPSDDGVGYPLTAGPISRAVLTARALIGCGLAPEGRDTAITLTEEMWEREDAKRAAADNGIPVLYDSTGTSRQLLGVNFVLPAILGTHYHELDAVRRSLDLDEETLLSDDFLGAFLPLKEDMHRNYDLHESWNMFLFFVGGRGAIIPYPGPERAARLVNAASFDTIEMSVPDSGISVAGWDDGDRLDFLTRLMYAGLWENPAPRSQQSRDFSAMTGKWVDACGESEEINEEIETALKRLETENDDDFQDALDRLASIGRKVGVDKCFAAYAMGVPIKDIVS